MIRHGSKVLRIKTQDLLPTKEELINSIDLLLHGKKKKVDLILKDSKYYKAEI